MSCSIFLSYRRQDSPGYVARLADQLEILFGERIFRDVDSILAGNDWKKALNQTVGESKIVLALIGRRWQALLDEKASIDGTADYVRFELNMAHLLGIPIIPILLPGTVFDKGRDMGDLDWLKELQFCELSDSQNRWDNDVARLSESITAHTGFQPRGLSGEETITQNSQQTSQGDQSPNIAAHGDVTISFGEKPK